jgi:zinc transport system substrate-binding protein
LAWVVERLAPALVDVEVILPPSTAPEGWSPTPTALLAVAEAGLFFGVGHPAIAFEERLIRQAAAADVETVLLADVTGRAGASSDPHLWLDPTLVAAAASELVGALGRIVPASTAEIETNGDALIAEIGSLDEAVRATLSRRRRDVVIVQHAAWTHLLRRYGISEEAIEQEGKEPQPGRMVEVVEIARLAGAPIVFAQEGVSDRSARLIAAELGARVVALDPLARDWAANLEHAAGRFAEATN